MQTHDLTAELFDPLIGETLLCATQIGDIALQLDAVKRQPERRHRDVDLVVDGKTLPPCEAFSLTLSGPVEPILGQGVYELSHDKLGKLTLFLSPFAQDAEGVVYSIDFN